MCQHTYCCKDLKRELIAGLEQLAKSVTLMVMMESAHHDVQ